MADSPAPEPTPSEPTEQDAETSFWSKFDSHMDEWFTKKFPADSGKKEPAKKDEPAPTGTSRTGGKRVTLATLFADAVFGPPKD